VVADGLAWLQVGNSIGSLTRNVRRIQSYLPFEPPPFLICSQGYITIEKTPLGVEEERREYLRNKDHGVNDTSQGRLSIPISPIVRR